MEIIDWMIKSRKLVFRHIFPLRLILRYKKELQHKWLAQKTDKK